MKYRGKTKPPKGGADKTTKETPGSARQLHMDSEWSLADEERPSVVGDEPDCHEILSSGNSKDGDTGKPWEALSALVHDDKFKRTVIDKAVPVVLGKGLFSSVVVKCLHKALEKKEQ